MALLCVALFVIGLITLVFGIQFAVAKDELGRPYQLHWAAIFLPLAAGLGSWSVAYYAVNVL